MPFFALFYQVVDNYAERRQPYRAEHLRLVQEARNRGDLLLAGALGEPIDGALLVFRVPDRSMVENFARNDPYVRNGLITRWDIKPWAVVTDTEPVENEPAGERT
jgi:hypothetical protein